MLELLFNYFITLIISATFCLLLYFNTIHKKKDIYIGYIFCSISIIFFFRVIFIQKSIINIVEHYNSYKLINENNVLKINYYYNESDYYNGNVKNTEIDKSKIKLFLNRANLNKGIYFKDVTTRDGYSEYLAEVISKDNTFIFEVYQDVDNYKVIDFIMPNKKRSTNCVGRYYFDN